MNKLHKTSVGRRTKNVATTRSGKTISINRSITDRIKSSKASNQARRATYLSTMPKDRWHRILFKLHPKNLTKFWFSRDGGIMILKIIGISIVIGFFLTVGLFAYFRKDLPKIKDLSGTLGGSITYYDRSGKIVLWQDYNAIKRSPVASDQMSKYIKQATVAIEDKGFYREGAFDVRGIMRAAFHDALGGGGSLQGGSTITQQLVKLNQDWTSNRTVSRKVKELILSVELERQYSKDDILTGYLNMAPYGGLDYGVETAAQDYFHVSAKNLTLAQAALLASIPQSPNYYSPYGSTVFNPSASNTFNKGALLGRQQYTLDQMAKQGYITKAQAEEAKKVDILAQVQSIQNKYSNVKAPYFVLAAKKELEQKYTAAVVSHGGWNVITTLDMTIQDKAEQLVASNLANVKRYGGDEEAMVVEAVGTGQISALVGGVDFNQPDYGQINYADQVLIPPGSSFKPYDYTSLINDKTYNAGAGSVLYDSQGPIVDPATGAGYLCTNKNLPDSDSNANCLWDYDRHYPGPLTLRYAISGSRNVPAVKAFVQAGINKTISLASAMMDNTYLQSIKQNTYNCYKQGTDLGSATSQDITQCYASAGIGDGAFLHIDDHVNGLSTLARLGLAIPRTFIMQINDSSNNLIYKWTQPKGNQVISADTAYIMNSMLSDPNASYFAAGTKFQHSNGWNFAVKTGTTNNNYDGLMTSWSTQYAVVSWVGHHTRTKALTTAMENVTTPLTKNMMLFLHSGLKPINWAQPSTVKTAPAFVITSHVGYGSVEPSPSTDLYPGWYVPKSGTGTNDAIDKVSGLLATTCTPDSAKSTTDNSNTNIFSIDWFINGAINKKVSTASVAATDNVHLCGELQPKVTSPQASGCIVGLDCTFTINVTAGAHPLNDAQYSGNPGTVNLLTGGKVVATISIKDADCGDSTVPQANCNITIHYTPTSAGSTDFVAQVIDSVLYTINSELNTVVITAASSPIVITTPTLGATNVGGSASVTWTGGSGTYSLSLDGYIVGSCTVTVKNCSVTIAGAANTIHTIIVTDNVADPTATVTFTK